MRDEYKRRTGSRPEKCCDKHQTLDDKGGLTKMCLLKNFQDVTNNRTILFIIVLLSLKLCSPQDLNEEFVNEESVDASDLSMVPVTKVQLPGNAGPCRLSELLCDTGQCISLDKYCNGEDDCGDKSDEPKLCTHKLLLFAQRPQKFTSPIYLLKFLNIITVLSLADNKNPKPMLTF
ncbi:unnamed protein product [Diatraea saccharalis]|uniref:Uncharacterized protein n=1 Tax=Diatraea saccharalis TaxID=40085 RepID=A0A9N9QZV4_9NEOP|nr:unnamed protein product [Diatraea saccharalis]